MSYHKIENLYRNPDALTLPEKECYAMEKIDGSSAKISFKDSQLHLFSGGSKYETFKSIFDEVDLIRGFEMLPLTENNTPVTVYGEAYGAKIQGFAHRYGDQLRFVAFEVKAGDRWLDVPDAEQVVRWLNLEFVHYVRIPCTVEDFDRERDKPSVQAERNGMGVQDSEGVIIRPLTERFREDGTRCIWKHKRERCREMRTPRSLDPDKNKVLEDAKAIAEEWVVPERLRHVMDSVAVKLEKAVEDLQIEHTREIIEAMVLDIVTEGKGEFVDTKEARQAIGRRAARLFHEHLKERIS